MRATNIRRLERETAFRPALAGIRAFRWGAAPGLREKLRDDGNGTDFGAGGVGAGRLSREERKGRNAGIRKMDSDWETQAAISEGYWLSRSMINRACEWLEGKAQREERDAQIRERYANLETQAAIARDCGISKTRVAQICGGVERKTREERDSAIRARYAGGETQRAIAEDYGMDRSTVGRICKGMERRAKPQRGPKPKNGERDSEIRARYAGGETQRAIAGDCGISQTRVSAICRGARQEGAPGP